MASIPATDRQQFKLMLAEMTNCLQKIDAEKEQFKEISAAAQDKYSIKKKLVAKLARVMYKHNYADLQAENEHFEDLYETLVEGKKDSNG